MPNYDDDINLKYKKVENDFDRLNSLYNLGSEKKEVKGIITENGAENQADPTDGDFSVDLNSLDGREDDFKDYREVVKYTPVKGKSVAVAVFVFIILSAAMFCTLVLPDILYKDDYNRAFTLYAEQKYPEAAEIFGGLGGYRDSAEMAKRTKYDYGKSLYKDKDYFAASQIFSEIPSYRNSLELKNECTYKYAGQLYQSGKFDKAIEVYKTIISYKDVETILNDTVYEEGFNAFLDGDYEKSIGLLKPLKDNSQAQQFVTISKAYIMDREKNAEPSEISSVMAVLGAMDNESARLALGLEIFKGEKLSGSWKSKDGLYSLCLDRSQGVLDIVMPMEEGTSDFKMGYGVIYRKNSDGEWENCLKIESFTPNDVSQPQEVVLYNHYDGKFYTLQKD